MLRPVWPNHFFWYFLSLISSFSWLFSSLGMDFLNQPTFLADLLIVIISLTSYIINVALFSLFMLQLSKPQIDRFFRGYEPAGKAVGSALLLLGNLGLYCYSDKSIASIKTFLSLALYCLCILMFIQPYTVFGLFEFFLSASLNQAWKRFGVHSFYSCLVLIACIVMEGLRYLLGPEEIVDLESSRIQPLTAVVIQDTSEIETAPFLDDYISVQMV